MYTEVCGEKGRTGIGEEKCEMKKRQEEEGNGEGMSDRG
jgi:hypothetical protein